VFHAALFSFKRTWKEADTYRYGLLALDHPDELDYGGDYSRSRACSSDMVPSMPMPLEPIRSLLRLGFPLILQRNHPHLERTQPTAIANARTLIGIATTIAPSNP
jgi:hypothetical protein